MHYLHKLVKFFLRYELHQNLLEWAGLLRYLGHSEKVFTIEEWTCLLKGNVHTDVVHSFFRILADEKKIVNRNGLISINDELSLQRDLEIAHSILNVILNIKFEDQSKLLWSVPIGTNIPSRIAGNFDHLNSWIQQVIQSTNERLVFFAPYYSEAGLKHFSISLSTLLSIRKEIRVDWIFGEINNEENEKAINFLKQNFASSNCNIYLPKSSDERDLVIHAKVLISDKSKGYMGSANFSKGALMSQFELGTILSRQQIESLLALIDYWIQSRFLCEYNK